MPSCHFPALSWGHLFGTFFCVFSSITFKILFLPRLILLNSIITLPTAPTAARVSSVDSPEILLLVIRELVDEHLPMLLHVIVDVPELAVLHDHYQLTCKSSCFLETNDVIWDMDIDTCWSDIITSYYKLMSNALYVTICLCLTV